MVRCPLLEGLLIVVIGSVYGAAQQTPVSTPPAAKTTTQTQSAKPAKHHKPVKAAPEKPKQAAVPPPPPTPEESPAAAPEVTYQNGQLTIRSENSTLGSILNAVRARTGATLDTTGVTTSDRIATQLGPGDPRDVLTSLLANSKYDYILLGAPGNPNAVQKIVLSARSNVSTQLAARGTAPQRNANQPAPAAQPEVDQELPDAEIPDQPEQPEQPPQPEQQPQPPAETDQSQQPNPNQPKTPEQLLQELQRMQQQQQQQQEQQRQQNLNPQ